MTRTFKLLLAVAGLALSQAGSAADDIGVFEELRVSSQGFDETVAAVEAALTASPLDLHATHTVRVPEDAHRASLFVLTSPAYLDAARDEPARTASAQILRVAVYTTGDDQGTVINMANPVAHAMVYYADSGNYDALVEAARRAAEEIRSAIAAVPGESLDRQLEPRRSEKHYNKYKGDGPARMMAKFRKWDASQLDILTDSADNFDRVAGQVVERLQQGEVAGADEARGWEVVTSIPLRPDVVYIGLTNPFIEDRMIGINSRFRSEGKSDNSPYPGVDHVAALPTDVLVVREGNQARVLHYGQMWRMQLYFWDSGYRAFTANVGVPGDIVNSIEDAIKSSQ